ncbi:Retrovirus-related Pol polyprotein from transposon [Apostichopus japonicus]|uniref:Retrovirus-related Pol polyprotein from transposon n=1 Tax=Stichopus japonicus TaxID=307972 RepID=A0A2G8LRL5_STIJA|nr:Retrovirus-related Pol polyprotein from transposon [Apostichopus japonicus]
MATGGTDDILEFTELAAEIEQMEREVEVRRHLFDIYKSDLEKERVAKSAVGDINGWSNGEKARFLGARLKGQAHEVYVDLSLSDKRDFDVIVRAFNQHFEPDALISVRKAALKNRVAAEGESLTSLCSSIRRDVIDAYPNVNRNAQDELAMDYFISALRDRDIRIAVRRGAPKTLPEALNLALEIEAIDRAEGVIRQKKAVFTVDTKGQEDFALRISKIESQMGRLQELSERMTKFMETWSSPAHVPAGGPPAPTDLEELYSRSGEQLDDKDKTVLWKFLEANRDVFSCKGEPLGRTGIVKHGIATGDARPIRQAPRRMPFHQRVQAQAEVDKMLEEGVISPSNSAWASPVVLVKKKDGSIRFCIDYRKLNNVTNKDAFPLPRIDDSLDALSGSQWFSTLDLRSGYWQVEMENVDKVKTAFSMGTGLYEFNVMPFGLCNAPGTFQRLMEQVLRGLHWRTCLIYIDDIIIYARTLEEH